MRHYVEALLKDSIVIHRFRGPHTEILASVHNSSGNLYPLSNTNPDGNKTMFTLEHLIYGALYGPFRKQATGFVMKISYHFPSEKD